MRESINWRRELTRWTLVVAMALVTSFLWNVIAGIGIALTLAIALDPRTTARWR